MKLPRRDLWLLPLVSLATMALMLGAAEIAARTFWPAQVQNSCHVPDPEVGLHFQPNCSSVMKVAEGPWYTNHYNECGYRSPQSCGPVAAGTLRVAMLGSSTAEGLHVAYDDTIAGRLASNLTDMCHSPVEVQNLGGAPYLGTYLIGRMKAALALKPDVVLLLVTTWDIESELSTTPPKIYAKEGAGTAGPLRRLFLATKESRAFTVAEHFLFRKRSFYISTYLHYGDKADYLRSPFSPAWQVRLQHYDELVGQLSDMARQAHVPLMLGFVPPAAAMVLMTEPQTPPELNPFALGRAIATIAARHGAAFTDTSPALGARDRPELLYYQIDSHLSGAGQPIAARSIAEGLTAGAVPPFARCGADQVVRTDASR